MKKNINKILLFALLLATGMVGCKKQLDINDNPNNPADDVIKAEHILPNALHFVGSNTATGYGWLANWVGYWSASGSYNPSTEESSYGITNTFQETKWTNTYNTLFDLRQVELKASAAGEAEDFYKGVSMVMQAHLFQMLVDLYGNIPYSQAFQPDEYPAPAYDEASAIYADLQTRLDAAIVLFHSATVTTRMEDVDIVCHGDTDLWIRLANTIKLRLLIRTTEVNANPAAEIAKIKAEGGVLESEETAAANPGYQNDNNKQSPFYAAYGLLPSGEDANTFYRANAYAVENLKVRNDPRLGYFFKPAKSPTNAGNPYVGTVYGSEPNTEFGGDQTSNIGEGLVKTFNQDQWILTSVESMFLAAEAIARGWDIGGSYTTAREAYEAAVTESFIWLGVEDAEDEAEAYLATNFANYDNAGGSTDAQVKFIVQQKYIALTGINPLEAWNDYRRLGVPANIPLSINTARGDRHIPTRLLYPSSEFAVNAASVAAQGSIDAQTSTIFWDK